MEIITYPHPTLRHKSKPIKRVDAELRSVIAEMFELMYEANGVGLAANQVDLPLRFFVVNVESDSPTSGEMVFINPVISHPKGSEEAEEGCLSLPGVYGQVMRPKKVRINAYNLQGEEVNADLDGLLARVVQHETDHLDGVLFIDRLSETGKLELEEALEDFETEFSSRLSTGGMPDNQTIASRWQDMEARYC